MHPFPSLPVVLAPLPRPHRGGRTGSEAGFHPERHAPVLATEGGWLRAGPFLELLPSNSDAGTCCQNPQPWSFVTDPVPPGPAAPYHFLSLWICLFRIFSIKGVIQYSVICNWLISLSMCFQDSSLLERVSVLHLHCQIFHYMDTDTTFCYLVIN